MQPPPQASPGFLRMLEEALHAEEHGKAFGGALSIAYVFIARATDCEALMCLLLAEALHAEEHGKLFGTAYALSCNVIARAAESNMLFRVRVIAGPPTYAHKMHRLERGYAQTVR